MKRARTKTFTDKQSSNYYSRANVDGIFMQLCRALQIYVGFPLDSIVMFMCHLNNFPFSTRTERTYN